MKSKDYNTAAEQELFDAAQIIAGAEYSRDQYGSCNEEMEKDAKERLQSLAKPLSAEECRAIGAPVHNANNSGSLTTQLRDTAKSPNAINAHAHAERLHLTKDARCMALAADMSESIMPQNSVERALSHQLAAAHAHAMRLLEKSTQWLDDARPLIQTDNHDRRSYIRAQASIEAVRLTNAAARMMKVYQEGVATLAKMRSNGQQQVTVVHQHVQVAGGNVAVAGAVNKGGGADDGE